MNEQPTPRSLIVDLGVLLASEVLGYIAFFVNVPFVMSGVMTAAFIVVVLQSVYGLHPFWFIHSSVHFHADFHDFLRFYAIAAFVLFLIQEIIRVVFRLRRPTLKQRVLAGVVVGTLGWLFIMVHLPFMKMAAGSSRFVFAMLCSLLYVVGIAGFFLGSLIAYASDALIANFVTLDKRPSQT